MANRITLPNGDVVVYADHLTPEEIAERVKSHVEHVEAGLSRSPRAMPAKVAQKLPMVTPVYAKPEWEPPVPWPQESWAEGYWRRKIASQRARHDEVYGRRRGRR